MHPAATASTNPARHAAPLVVQPPALPAAHATSPPPTLRDIKGPIPIPSGWAWVAWLLACLTFALLAFLALRVWRRRQRQAPATIIVPPHVRARNRLRAARALLARPDPFCTEVSQALRQYLEERFELHAPERTTEEFLDELQTSPCLARGQKLALGDFLTRCDLVKFARHEPTESHLLELWEAALRLVDQTAPSPALEPGQDAAPGVSGGASLAEEASRSTPTAPG